MEFIPRFPARKDASCRGNRYSVPVSDAHLVYSVDTWWIYSGFSVIFANKLLSWGLGDRILQKQSLCTDPWASGMLIVVNEAIKLPKGQLLYILR